MSTEKLDSIIEKRVVKRGNKVRIESNCEYCGKIFDRTKAKYYQSKHHFCSHKCSTDWVHQQTPKTKVKCRNCGIDFEKKDSEITNQKHFYCSRKCRDRFHIENSHQYQDYISEKTLKKKSENSKEYWTREGYRENQIEIHKGRQIPISEQKNKYQRTSEKEWLEIATKIRKRDGYVCQYCKSDEGYIVHHIVPWRISGDDRDLNLITLCKSCHGHIEPKWDEYVNYFQINIIQKMNSNDE